MKTAPTLYSLTNGSSSYPLIGFSLRSQVGDLARASLDDPQAWCGLLNEFLNTSIVKKLRPFSLLNHLHLAALLWLPNLNLGEHLPRVLGPLAKIWESSFLMYQIRADKALRTIKANRRYIEALTRYQGKEFDVKTVRDELRLADEAIATIDEELLELAEVVPKPGSQLLHLIAFLRCVLGLARVSVKAKLNGEINRAALSDAWSAGLYLELEEIFENSAKWHKEIARGNDNDFCLKVSPPPNFKYMGNLTLKKTGLQGSAGRDPRPSLIEIDEVKTTNSKYLAKSSNVFQKGEYMRPIYKVLVQLIEETSASADMKDQLFSSRLNDMKPKPDSSLNAERTLVRRLLSERFRRDWRIEAIRGLIAPALAFSVVLFFSTEVGYELMSGSDEFESHLLSANIIISLFFALALVRPIRWLLAKLPYRSLTLASIGLALASFLLADIGTDYYDMITFWPNSHLYSSSAYGN